MDETYVSGTGQHGYLRRCALLSASGIIATEEDNTVEDVEVSLSGQDNDVMMTGADGWFGFSPVLEGYDYTITPMRRRLPEQRIDLRPCIDEQAHSGSSALDSPAIR